MPLLTWELWLARPLSQDKPLPWQKAQTIFTPGRARQSIAGVWISLPKASLDDNPCETIFSDLQLNVQDNSDDPDEQMMRKRISHRLNRRNRRGNRFIAIPYLWDSHKG